METYFAVIAGLGVLALWTLVVAGVITLFAFQKTAQSLEKLTQKIEERADAFKNVTDVLETVANGAKSTWFKGATVLFDILGSVRSRRKEKKNE